MNRRELLKAVIATSVNGRLKFSVFKLEPSAKYILFYNSNLGPKFVDEFKTDFPGVVAYPIDVSKGMSLENAIRIFEEQ